MTGDEHALNVHATAADPSPVDPPEMSARARVIRWGVGVTLVMAVASAIYAAATWQAPHRSAILAIAFVALVDAVIIARALDRLVRVRRYPEAMALWNAGHVGCAAVLCALDGGIGSPFTAIFFLSAAFAAVSLPTRVLLFVAILDVATVVGVGATYGSGEAGAGAAVLWTAGLIVTGAVCAAIAADRERRIHALETAKKEMLHQLARVIEFRDTDTGDHIGRMSAYAALIAGGAGHPAPADDFRAASAMHDIGKVAVPDAVLLKPGRLTPEERAVMERHAQVGHDMLADSSVDLLDLAAEIALTHHERWDGAGYPAGLAGPEIPLSGRVVAVADVFDALTSDRVYKQAMPVDEAVEVIRSGSGTQFDPRAVAAFEARLGEILVVRERSAAASVPV